MWSRPRFRRISGGIVIVPRFVMGTVVMLQRCIAASRQSRPCFAAILIMAWKGFFGPADAGTANGFSRGLRPFVVPPSGGKGHNGNCCPVSPLFRLDSTQQATDKWMVCP